MSRKKNPTAEELRQRVVSAVIPDDPSILLDEFQVAKMLGISVFKLRRDRWSGGGIPFIVLGGSVRYSRTKIDATMNSNTRKSTSDPGPMKAA